MRDRFFGANKHLIVILTFVAVIAVGSCSEEDKPTEPIPPKKIETPGTPTALNSARPGMAIEFCVDDGGGGAGTEYQWDFDAAGDDTVITDWLPDSCISRAWAAEGQYVVKARARARGITTEWTAGFVVTIIDETVLHPMQPTGDDILPVGLAPEFCASGSVSSLSHPIEYRFSLEPLPPSAWSIAKCVSFVWTEPGEFRIRAQARCLFHNGIFSEWSQSIVFTAVSGADTQILRVTNSPTAAGTAGQDINFADAQPDTVPQGSWLTLVVEGSSPNYSFGECNDAVNQCLGFQLQYETLGTYAANSQVTSDWLPMDAFDSNPGGAVDTLRIQVGVLDYTVNGRAVDEFGGDVTPASVPVVANFSPTLDDFYIEHHDGAIIRNGETLRWDWWSPANTDTFDFVNSLRKKEFFFVIKGTGHDDARDPVGAAIKTWQYFFIASNDPIFFGDFARAGNWVEGQQSNAICDTFTWTVTYPIDDVVGDTVFSSLPTWINRGWDFAIRGRDSGPLDQFDQVVKLNGQIIQTSSYSTANSGRRTANGFQQFSLAIDR